MNYDVKVVESTEFVFGETDARPDASRGLSYQSGGYVRPLPEGLVARYRRASERLAAVHNEIAGRLNAWDAAHSDTDAPDAPKRGR